MSLKIASLEIKKKDSTIYFDFTENSVIESSSEDMLLIIELLKNLLDKDYILPGALSYSIVLEISSSEDIKIISIFMDYESKKYDLRINGDEVSETLLDICKEITHKDFGMAHWKNLHIECTQESNFEVLVGQTTSIVRALNPNINIETEVSKKRENLEGKIKELEKGIEEYKNSKEVKQNNQDQIKKLEEEIKVKDELLASTKDLIQILNKLDLQLAKFGNYVKDPDLQSKVKNIKKNRIQKVIALLKNIKVKSQFLIADGSKPKTKEEKSFLTYFLGAIILQALFSIFLFIIVQSLIVIYISILLFLLIFGAMTYLKMSLSGEISNAETRFEVNNYNYKSIPYDQVIEKFDSKEDSFLVNAAWVQAINHEKMDILSSISKRLGGANYKDYVDELMSLKLELSAIETKVRKMNKDKVTAENYLIRRRELDIAKLDLDDLDTSDIGNLDIYAQKLGLPLVVIAKSRNILDDNAEYQDFKAVLKLHTQIIEVYSK